MASTPRLFLIDTYGFIFRAYHARARSGAPPMRTSSGLPTEVVYIFGNMLRKMITTYHPEYIAAIFESLGPTFREQSFAEYKANRAETPPDLSLQVPYVRRLLEAMHIPILEYQGFEADDVIGTISCRATLPVVIVSSDKDMLQLVNERVSMYNPAKDDTWYDPAKAEEFMGVPPSRVADLLALKGDAIDNIPGAPGIGDKGARDLITQFGTVDQILERAAEVTRKTYRESLQNNRDQILLSKQLATIDTNVPIEWSLESMSAREPDVNALKQFYREMEFFSLLKELGPSDDTAGKDYGTLDSTEAISEFLAAMPAGAPLAVSLLPATESVLDGMQGALGLSWKVGLGRSVSLAHLEQVRSVLEDPDRPKVAHDIKDLMLKLREKGLKPSGFEHDVMLYAFLLNADPAGCSHSTLSERYLDRKLGEAAEHLAECTLELYEKLAPEIDAHNFRELYQTIDLPLISVLTRMQETGIRIAPAELSKLSEHMDAEMTRLAARTYELAGKPFNINSPQQLGKVLYEDLKLPAPVKYGKGKTLSTAADILEALAEEHEIAKVVLEYRQLAKLKGTYVDALPALIDERTGRLHTTLHQTGAATGRLSSSNPNLQNIPIRTELGREIRAAFVPREDWVLIAADYSQIELRLLAHYSLDPVLVDAFRRGEDIHTRTASEVFKTAPLMVTPEMRRAAKAVNFGIVYGQTPFGLATSLGIDRKEAELYIRSYFELYRGVRKFIDNTIAEVRQTGVARTLFGRERPIPDMHARNPNARSFAERTAVNTPLQGSAADLIKLAMIRIDQELDLQSLQTRMLLQVHDELLFEAPPEEVETVRRMVKHEMESVRKLEVPLVVDVGMGANWRDAK